MQIEPKANHFIDMGCSSLLFYFCLFFFFCSFSIDFPSFKMTIFLARPAVEAPISTYDPYAGMKTPGQRQLISLQERVKVGEITVEEAVQEFRAWQFDHERRASSLRYQQVILSGAFCLQMCVDSFSHLIHVCLLKENLKKLRDSITRRHKEREKVGKDLGRTGLLIFKC